MNWKPTEGLRRAEPIVRRLIEDSATANLEIRDPVFAHHVTTVLAQALDDALRDGSEMDALASVVGNGQHPEGWDGDVHFGASGNVTKVKLHKGEYEDIPAAAEALGVPASQFYRAAAEKKVEEVKKKRGRPPGRPKKAKPAQEASA